MEVRFTVFGQPRGKERHRTTTAMNKFTGQVYSRTYTPTKTVNYENMVKNEYIVATKIQFPDDAMLDMRIKAYYQIPKSASKSKREKMISGKIRPMVKPDVDNIEKIIADSLNKLAYRDDAQIVDIQCRKFYSDTPRVEVVIKQI